MKTYQRFSFLLLLFVYQALPIQAQFLAEHQVQVIEPYPLQVAYTKTTNLIFPYAINSVDKGSHDLLAQKANGVENILQIKAGKEDFKETNLTVITAQGKIYSFLVRFDHDPKILNLKFHQQEAEAPYFSTLTHRPHALKVQENAAIVAYKSKTLLRVQDRKQGLSLSLKGLFIQGDVMYYQIRMKNKSNINFQFDQLRFFVQDQRKSTRVATQEVELLPLHIHNPVVTIAAQSEQLLVYALEKRTLANRKRLKIQVMEINGGRHLELTLKNNLLMKAKPLGPTSP